MAGKCRQDKQRAERLTLVQKQGALLAEHLHPGPDFDGTCRYELFILIQEHVKPREVSETSGPAVGVGKFTFKVC
jgi:hypothetical protein